MTNFEFVFSLFGLLLGLALPAVLGGLSNALQERRKIKVGWLTPLLGLLVALDIASFWTITWSIRNALQPNYFYFLIGLLVTGTYFFIARMVFPTNFTEWPEFDVYYFGHKRWVLIGVLFCNVAASAAQVALGAHPFSSLLDKIMVFLFFPGLAAAALARGKRLNIGLLLYLVLLYPLGATLSQLHVGTGDGVHLM